MFSGLESVGAISMACLEYCSALASTCMASGALDFQLRGSVCPINASVDTSLGVKAISFAPSDVSPLALMGQTLPRSWKSSAPDAMQMLAKAEQYSKQAIEIAPTLSRPENMTEEAFASARNQALAMAHSGLGLVYVRRGKHAEAIPEIG